MMAPVFSLDQIAEEYEKTDHPYIKRSYRHSAALRILAQRSRPGRSRLSWLAARRWARARIAGQTREEHLARKLGLYPGKGSASAIAKPIRSTTLGESAS